MSLHKQLKTAADKLEQLAADNGAHLTKIAELEKKLASATQHVKTAGAEGEAKKAKLAGLAKTAAEKLRTAGMISSSEMSDTFAAQVLDHETALAKIATLAEQIKPVKMASVMIDSAASAATPDANAVWDRQVQGHAGKLPVR